MTEPAPVGWVRDAIHELQIGVEKARGGDLAELRTHISDAQDHLDTALEELEEEEG